MTQSFMTTEDPNHYQIQPSQLPGFRKDLSGLGFTLETTFPIWSGLHEIWLGPDGVELTMNIFLDDINVSTLAFLSSLFPDQ